VGDLPPVSPDTKGPIADLPPLTSYKVAAIQYDGDYATVAGCSDDLCGITSYVKEAKKSGALLVVAAEGAISQKTYETSPNLGDHPGGDSRWSEGTIIKTMSKLADDENLTLVFHLRVLEGSTKYSASIAVDPTGEVIARHYKFDLYTGETVTPGTSVDKSFFETPAGKAGMLICADVECLVTGLKPTENCAATSPDILKAFAAQKPSIVVFSTAWTIPGDESWPWSIKAVLKNIATSFQSYVVAANSTHGGGPGGGVYKPDGTAITSDFSGKPMVLYAELPLKK